MPDRPLLVGVALLLTSSMLLSCGIGRPRPATSTPGLAQLQQRLDHAVLQVGDLPPGWQAMVVPRNDTSEMCGGASIPLAPGLAEAEVGFMADGDGSVLVQRLRSFSPAEAKALMATARHILQTCTSITATLPSGAMQVWQLQPLPYPRYGDESVAYRETTTEQGQREVANIVASRRASIIDVLLQEGRDAVDDTQTRNVAQRADAKLKRVAP